MEVSQILNNMGNIRGDITMVNMPKFPGIITDSLF